MSSVAIQPLGEDNIDSFHAALDSVARERAFLSMFQAPPIDETRAFVLGMIERENPMFVALDDAQHVVGWCDISRGERAVYRHCGALGMGLLPNYRGLGLGRRLIETTVGAAWHAGMRRVELSVYASNTRAETFYRKMGFVEEGRAIAGADLGSGYVDVILMAKIRIQ